MSRWPALASLRLRLLAATLVSLALALGGAHWWLSELFREHVMRQFDVALVQQLDQLTARLEFDVQGQPLVPAGLSDPRWDKPYSGLYWQIDRLGSDGLARRGVLRSRSLWDVELTVVADELVDGAIHTHDGVGPQGHALRVVERSLQSEGLPARWRLLVAADTQEAWVAGERFKGVSAASLAALGLLLALAAWAQVAVGLAPLQALQRALRHLRQGRTHRLQGRFPAEVQPLIDDFNSVLDLNAQVVTRARTQAGNLAHALKTPLAVLDNAARSAPSSELSGLVQAQVQAAQRHIQWHLARSRAAASLHLPGQRTPVLPLLEGLLRVMEKVHAGRSLAVTMEAFPDSWAFAGEAQDLQDMLGNLLDNACRCARHEVRVSVQHKEAMLHIAIEDDGPGIAPERREEVLQRGVRLDESTPGSGLGLAIVVELAGLYGGSLKLDCSALGGLSAHLALPAAQA